MSRPAVEVADILRAHEARFLDKNRSWLSFQQLTVLRAIRAKWHSPFGESAH